MLLWNLLCNIKPGSDWLAHSNTLWEREPRVHGSVGRLTSAHIRTAVTDACGPGPRGDMLGCHNRSSCHDCKERIYGDRDIDKDIEVNEAKSNVSHFIP